MAKNNFLTIKANPKQMELLKYWNDSTTDEILYGGAKAGGKTFIGVTAIFLDAFRYPQTHYFIARKTLTALIKFTLPSINEVFKLWRVPPESYKFNGKDNYFELKNGSRVYLLDCKYLPSDPDFHRLGSMQMTRGWIEEAGEFESSSYANLKISIGRWNNQKYNLRGKLLITANPTKNFLYTDFYLPEKENRLPEHKKFIQALPRENKRLAPEYIQNLERTLKGSEKLRLLEGLWEYEDDPTALCPYEKIIGIFSNDHIEQGEAYLTADVARFGSDKSVIMVWRGFEVVEIQVREVSATTELQALIFFLRQRYQIPKNRCIADEDGVGAGVVDNTQIIGFTNNARPFKENKNEPPYKNLQTQCIYKLAELINSNGLYISADISQVVKAQIIQELEELKTDNKDGAKLSVISKEQIKQQIGRSPDFRDALLMRMYFSLKPQRTFSPSF